MRIKKKVRHAARHFSQMTLYVEQNKQHALLSTREAKRKEARQKTK